MKKFSVSPEAFGVGKVGCRLGRLGWRFGVFRHELEVIHQKTSLHVGDSHPPQIAHALLNFRQFQSLGDPHRDCFFLLFTQFHRNKSLSEPLAQNPRNVESARKLTVRHGRKIPSKGAMRGNLGFARFI